MERSKKQRKDQQLKQSLKTLLSIEPHLLSTQANTTLLQKLYPQVLQLNSLRILTILQIIYLLQIYLDFIQTQSKFSCVVQNWYYWMWNYIKDYIKFDFVFLKGYKYCYQDGLVLKNITVSTRQTDNLKFYVDNFGIKAVFDNEATAKQSDFLIIATPSTLDNWIILDLKQSLNARIRLSQKNILSFGMNLTLASAKISTQKTQKQLSKPSLVQDRKNRSPKNEHKNSILLQKSQFNKKPFNPLVYILTSDFDDQKCTRLFGFPVLTPSIRITNMKIIKQKLKQLQGQSASLQRHQKVLGQWLYTKQQPRRGNIQSRQSVDLQISTQNEILQNYNKYLQTPFGRIINTFAFVYNSNIHLPSINSSYTHTLSNTESMKGRHRDQSLIQVLDILTQNNTYQTKLYKKLKKWQMGHNNYIS